jgi:DNA invertase Pin-like site-specific DNA recombinase
MTGEKFVPYYRVSTEHQGKNGLGIEAQRSSVLNYLSCHDGNLIEAFTEVESGKVDDRPELTKAVRLCRRTKATPGEASTMTRISPLRTGGG